MAKVPGIDSPPHSRYEIAVVSNALDLLLEIGARGPLSMSDVVDALGVSRSAAYRLLVTLEQRRFVARDRLTRRWSLGSAFLAIASEGKGTSLRSVALDSMHRLLDEEQETVNLAEFANGRLVYLEIVESPLPFRTRETPGDEAPLLSTALGKAILAALAPDEQAALLGTNGARPRGRRDLEAELEAVRERGWAIEIGETTEGVACIGAAILDGRGLPAAGISVSLPEARLGPGRAERIGERVAEEAQRITQVLTGASEVTRSTTPRPPRDPDPSRTSPRATRGRPRRP